MKSTASAPGKVILFGEHFVLYGGKAILCSINKRIFATSQFLDEKKVKVRSSLGNAELDIRSISELDFGTTRFMRPFFYIAKRALEEHGENKGIEIVLESEVPAGIGLGSSSAVCVAVTASVNGLFERLSKQEVVKRAIEAERIIFKETSGADTSVSTFGGLMIYGTNSGFQEISSKNDLDLVIANSSQVHNTKEIVRQVRTFKEKNVDFFDQLCKQEDEIVNEALSALKKNDLNTLGLLMSKNQDLLQEIKVSTKQIDLLIREAKKTSYGAKITGAGVGGCIISLVDNSNLAATIDNLKKVADCFPVKIDYQGLLYI
ncbi:MAG: mevalonate kinase [Thaumarchaeota archaeon 13_1_40CM_4_38_7]|nr:MAG: mevalonate kinase [Thaumarchaeota archaeon 13_1_40CM_4_38_7]OLC94579.1 MAG: mevalonate kinase [Thaumarchaeota archaeon 13_1_40CM_3_38_6]